MRKPDALPAPFFSLDGIDGAGKSTQCRLLVDWLSAQNRQAVLCTDPGGSEIGIILRKLLLEHRGHMSLPCEALLFMASRAQLTAEVIRPALEAGIIVVSDRFSLANIVYQGHAGGLDPEQLAGIARFATSDLEPDRTFVLDVPMALARTRRKEKPDRLESREEAYHERVRQGFLAEAQRHPERIRVVDASLSVEQIQEHIRREVSLVLGSHPRP